MFISIVYPYGLIHLFPPTMLPSYFHLQLSYFQTFSSITFLFPHIIYSTLFHRLDHFSGSSFPMYSLPASNYSILSSVHQSSRLVLPYPLAFPFLPPEPPSFLTARVILPIRMWPAAILTYAVSQLHEGTGKLRKPVQLLAVSEKWPPVQRFWCAGRGPAVTHPSTDPAKGCLTWVIAWHRTPTTHRRTLSLLILKYVFRNFWNSVNQKF